MKSLYPLIITGVLLLSACGSPEQSEGDTTGSNGSEAEVSSATVEATPERADSLVSVLFLGDSITAAYGLTPEQGFTALLQNRVDSLGLPVRIINAGLSGETSAGGLRRVPWVLRQPIDILVLELGGNDGLRGIQLNDTRQNLQAIIDTTRALNPGVDVIVAGMMIPPNLGADYTQEFQQLYPSLAEANNTELIPFLLEDVGGIDELMQSDGIHPNAAGNRIMAETVWSSLEPVLRIQLAER